MTNSNQIKINYIAKTFGAALTTAGFKMVKSSYDSLAPVQFPFGFIKEATDKIKSMSVSQRDYFYYFTNWENEEEMLAVIWRIVKNFKWEKDKFDCDDRSKLVSALHSLFFGLNSCGEIYCKVTNLRTGDSVLHWANIIITSNGDAYLFDCSNSGLAMKLKPGEFAMGKWSYVFNNCRF